MGWANCGTDREGRPIGYAHETVCDQDGCNKEIDRGLDFACGGMHGEDEYSCEKYFCWDHRAYIFIGCIAGVTGCFVCPGCAVLWDKEHVENEDGGCDDCRQAQEE